MTRKRLRNCRLSQGVDSPGRISENYLPRNYHDVPRNYRTPGRGGGEIDLVMREGATLVFVEVRRRASRRFGGAAASVQGAKQRRIVFAARHYLMRLRTPPPCRFDVVAVEEGQIEWLRAAFDAQ